MGLLERLTGNSSLTHNSELQSQNATNAFKLFLEVSANFPASVTAQAAAIAQRCQKDGLSPDYLLRALRVEPGLVKRIVEAADSAHAKSNNPYVPKSVARNTGVIRTDFDLAECYMAIPESRLPIALDLYRQLRSEGFSPTFFERSYRQRVNRMIRNPRKFLKAEWMSILIDFNNAVNNLDS